MLYDLLIIGAGPAGLAAALYASERRMKTLILEGNKPGGQLVTLYPDKMVYDYPSYRAIKAGELGKKMVDHAYAMGCAIQLQQQVDVIKKEESRFLVGVASQMYESTSVLLASGMGLFLPKSLGIPGEKELAGKGVFYQELPEEYRSGKRGLFIGGGDTALEMAVMYAGASTVSIIHRHDSFRALEVNVEKIKEKNIQTFLDSEVKAFLGSDRLMAVQIVNHKTNAVKELPFDFVVICAGVELQPSFLPSIGVSIDKNAVVVDSSMQTTLPGLFSAGDIAIPAGQYKRITLAQGQAALAVQGAYLYSKNPYWAKA